MTEEPLASYGPPDGPELQWENKNNNPIRSFMDWRNPFKKFTRTLAVPPWLVFTLLDFRLVERETDGRITPGAVYLPHPGRTVFHNAAFSVQVCFPFFFSVQVKPFEKGRYFQAYLGFRPHSGWSGAKLRLATYAAEVIYNPGMAGGWKRGWS